MTTEQIIKLHYGKEGLNVRLPDGAAAHIIRKPPLPVLASPELAVRNALNRPVGCESIDQISSAAKTACIAICDITRPVPNHLFLRPLAQRLMNRGIDPGNITVLIATGLHRPNLGSELAELIGDPWVLEHLNVVNHNARDDAQHVSLGETSTRGTVVRLDRRFVEADLRIATGLVEPHFMAGYSGGRKVIAPGLAHAETITTFHNARFMSDPDARNCNFENNPLHEEQLEILRMLGRAFALNTVIDEQRNLAMVNFGEIIESHMQAVEFVSRYCEIPVPRRFTTVLTCAAGYPLDKTYYQTVKGMVGALGILEPGGDLIIASECSEGMGSPEYREAQKQLVTLGRDAFLQKIHRKTHADIDQWQTQMQTKTSAAGRVLLYSDKLPQSEHALTGVEVVASVEQAIASSLKRHATAELAVIPEGPYVVPFFRQ